MNSSDHFSTEKERRPAIELKSWRFIDTKIGSAESNMAVDEALLQNFKEGDMPILRLYRWETCISLGRFSELRKSVDIKVLQKQDIGSVRRMTGGGVLVHGGDLSYTMILPRSFLKQRGVKESYRYLCGFLHIFYEKLGYKSGFASELGVNVGSSDICMASNEEYDIIIEGKKMGGNAQRHTTHVMLQHGSIPLRAEKRLFEDLFLEGYDLKEMATLQEMGSVIEDERAVHLVRESFCESFGAELFKDELTLIEKSSVTELIAEKYGTKRWNIDAKQNRSQA